MGLFSTYRFHTVHFMAVLPWRFSFWQVNRIKMDQRSHMIAKQWEARIVEGQNCRLQKEVILILSFVVNGHNFKIKFMYATLQIFKWMAFNLSQSLFFYRVIGANIYHHRSMPSWLPFTSTAFNWPEQISFEHHNHSEDCKSVSSNTFINYNDTTFNFTMSLIYLDIKFLFHCPFISNHCSILMLANHAIPI